MLLSGMTQLDNPQTCVYFPAMIFGTQSSPSTFSRIRKIGASFVAIALTAGSVMSGCADDAGGDDDGGSTVVPGGEVAITDANNYSSTSVLTLGTIPTAPGTDLEICWEGVIQDMQCHGIDPLAGIDSVTLLRFDNWEQAEIIRRLGIGNIKSSELGFIADTDVDHVTTCTQLSTFTTFGQALAFETEYVAAPEYTYVMVFSQGTVPGVGAQTMVFVDPVMGNTNTRVDGPPGCPGILNFTADIKEAAPVVIPAAGPWVVNWSGVTTESNGVPLPFSQVSSVLIGFYAGMTAADLEAGFLNIEQTATLLYEMPHDGASLKADLSVAVERTTGAAFPGFDRTDGVWMLAMMCEKCQNPAPLIMTLVQPG